MSTIHDRPLAATGLKSYRYRTGGSFIMIGAYNHADALKQAKRSLDHSHLADAANLEAWDGTTYRPVSSPSPRDAAGRGEAGE